MKIQRSLFDKLMPRYDRLQHFYLGYFISALTATFLVNMLLGGSFKPLVILVTLIFAVGWELYWMKVEKTFFDPYDVWYSILPSFFVTYQMYL